MTLQGTYEELAARFRAIIDDYIEATYPRINRSADLRIPGPPT